jgi:hypothetical protein
VTGGVCFFEKRVACESFECLSASISLSLFFACFQNQFFISGLKDDETIQNRVLEALYRRILKAHKEQKCFRVIVVLPLLPGFQVLVLGFISKQLDSKFRYLSLYFCCELFYYREAWMMVVQQLLEP